VQTDNFRFDKTEKQQKYLTTKPSIKGNFVRTDLRDKKECAYSGDIDPPFRDIDPPAIGQ